jgi:hypothetical protein
MFYPAAASTHLMTDWIGILQEHGEMMGSVGKER